MGIVMLFMAIGLYEPQGMMEYSNWGEAPNLHTSPYDRSSLG